MKQRKNKILWLNWSVSGSLSRTRCCSWTKWAIPSWNISLLFKIPNLTKNIQQTFKQEDLSSAFPFSKKPRAFFFQHHRVNPSTSFPLHFMEVYRVLLRFRVWIVWFGCQSSRDRRCLLGPRQDSPPGFSSGLFAPVFVGFEAGKVRNQRRSLLSDKGILVIFWNSASSPKIQL